MKQTPEPLAQSTTRVSSPHPALQALLPRLGSIGRGSEDRPIFDDPEEVESYLEQVDDGDDYHVVPVWSINHTDLTSSKVVNWTYRRWLN